MSSCPYKYGLALKRKLEEKPKLTKNNRPISVNYNPNDAVNEFEFINLNFYPSELDCNPQTYVVCPSSYRETILKMMKHHFNMHLLIPVGAQGNMMTPEAIRESASDEKQAEIRHANKHNRKCKDGYGKRKRNIDTETTNTGGQYFTDITRWDIEGNNVALLEAQVVEDHDVNNPSDNYDININKDPYEEARSYIKSNWKLFTKAFEQICSEKTSNNWLQ
ncbi:15043_t:CDS:2, partial [Cetraspora pellucida]